MPDPEGVTPLIMAVTNMHFNTAAYLIKAGANVDKWDCWGRNARLLRSRRQHAAAWRPRRSSVVG
jgi:ankyrin repeat protein